MATISQIFETLPDASWVVPSGTGYIKVANTALWRAGWHVWLQGTNSVVLLITSISATTRLLAVTRVDLATNPAAGVAITGALSLVPLPWPTFDEPGEVPETYQPYQVNRVPFVVPTGANVDYLWYVKQDFMNPVWTTAGLRIFVQGIGTFEVAESGLQEDVATIDAVPYVPCIKVPVKVVSLLTGVEAGVTNVPDGAIFYAFTNQLDVVQQAAVHNSAFWDLALTTIGPYSPVTEIPVTSEVENTDPDEVYGKVTSGAWQAVKAGVYHIELFLVFNLAGYTPSDIVAPQAGIRAGGVPIAFGAMGTVVNGDRMALHAATFHRLAADDIVTAAWYDQPGSGVPQNLQTAGGSAGILSYLKITFLREA